MGNPFIVFGGSFNPVHLGHIQAAQKTSEHFGDIEIRMMLAANPRLRPEPPVETRHRWQMLKLACEGYSQLEPDDLEVKSGGISRTIDTVKALGGSESSPVVLLLGDEAARKLPQWVAFDQLKNKASFFILKRQGSDLRDVLHELVEVKDSANLFEHSGSFSICDAQTPAISATKIRKMIKQGKKPTSDIMSQSVFAYIIENELYSN